MFPHWAMVTVPSTATTPWGGDGGLINRGVPALEESWGVRGHHPVLRGHFSFPTQGQGYSAQKSCWPLGGGGQIGQCPRVGGVMGSMKTPLVSSRTLRNHHSELVMCSLSSPWGRGTGWRGAGGISWYFHAQGSLEIHGDTFFAVDLPVKSYLQLTAKNGDLTKRGSQALGWTGHVR
jgi:hypothetical protein